MSRSYERINYSLRPAKCIERKMLVEVLHRLSEFGSIESHRYIGFGSVFFSDFILLHKALGIRNMISIERDEENRERFDFNKPFGCIKLEFGESSEVLPRLNWDNVRTVLWLDYDGKLDAKSLGDVAFFFARSCPGSVIVVSVNAHPYHLSAERSRLEQLRDHVGYDRVPPGTVAKDLDGWGLAEVSWRIIHNEISEALNSRNGGRPEESKFAFRQLFHFNYADGAKMLTVGGLLYDRGQVNMVEKCAFDRIGQPFPFTRSGAEAFKIVVPSLTFREMRTLDTHLPCEDLSVVDSGLPLEERDIGAYAKVYRKFPAFTEVEL